MSQIQINTLIRCPYCHDSIMEGGPRAGCPECLAWHHAACLSELGRCGACAQPRTERSGEELEQAVEEVLKARTLKRCQYAAPHCERTETVEIQGMRICEAHAGNLSFPATFAGATFAITGLVGFVPLLITAEEAIQVGISIGFCLLLFVPGALLWRYGLRVSREARDAVSALRAERRSAERARAASAVAPIEDQRPPAKALRA